MNHSGVGEQLNTAREEATELHRAGVHLPEGTEDSRKAVAYLCCVPLKLGLPAVPWREEGRIGKLHGIAEMESISL